MPNCAPAGSLTRLTDPLSRAEFFARHRDREHLHVARENRSYFSFLVSQPEMEFLLAAGCRSVGDVEAFRDGERTQACTTSTEAIDAFALGVSLRINSVNRFSAALALFASSLEQQFSAPVSVNAYLSPPGSRALGRHYDSHDVFIAQLQGSKRWRICDGRVRDPVEFLPLLRREQAARKSRVRLTGPERDDADRPLLDELVLRAGDSLYLPRGYYHECEAEEGESSWHLTFGVHAYTYIDLLTIALGHAARSLPELRQRLPAGFGTHTEAGHEVASHVQTILSLLPGAVDPAAALAGIAAAFHEASRSLPLLPTFERREPVSGDSLLQLRPGCLCRVEHLATADGDRVRISFNDLDVTLPADFDPALRLLATGKRFAPGELPGNITADEKVALAEKLLQDGLLVLVGNAGVAGDG